MAGQSTNTYSSIPSSSTNSNSKNSSSKASSSLITNSPDHSAITTAFGPDDQPTKRQRVSLACDTCRKKKIKCNGKTPACTNCVNNKLECTYTQPERKIKPKKTLVLFFIFV